MKDLINEQPEQNIYHCDDCIHSADSLDVCVLRKCKYAIGELIDCYEPKQFEQSWIPCSERLPEEAGWYIASGVRDVGNRWYSTLHGWEETTFRVVAWMPLPEPAKL